MPQRPYASFSFEKLEAIAIEKNQDETTLKKIKHELTFRNTRASRRLASQLERGEEIQESTPIRRNSRSGNEVNREAVSEFEFRYEALRRTFTEKSSIMAKWGVSELLPQDILLKVFALWKTQCSEEPDSFGRSKSSLMDDMIKLGLDVSGKPGTVKR
jgi:hypothetical protein